MAQAVQAYLAHVAEASRPHATGATYVNFLDLDGASPERVKAAYSVEDWERLVQQVYEPETDEHMTMSLATATTLTAPAKVTLQCFGYGHIAFGTFTALQIQ